MEISISGTAIKIEFSFVLMLSFAVLLQADDIVRLLVFSALHEFGHLIVLLLFGGRPDCLTLSYYGLALKYTTPLLRYKEVLLLTAGPVVNLILYLILRDDINLILFCLNSLPVYPLDGGRILRLYSYNASRVISSAFLALLVILSVVLIIKYKTFSLLLICIYIIAYSINSWGAYEKRS